MLSQRTGETKGGDDIAKTQTQTLPFWDPRVSPQQNEITNEGEEMTERSATLEGDLKCCSSEMCLSPRRCWVEHSEIKTVRTGVTCVTLPGAAKCKTLLSAELVCAFTPFFFSLFFLKTVSQHRCARRRYKWKSQCLVCVFVSPRVHCATAPSPFPLPPPCLALFVQQWDLAVVTVVAAHLAVGGVEVGGVGEGRREGVIVRGGVAGRGKQRLGIRLWRRRWGVVVLVLACGGPAAVAQSLTLSQLVAERRHPLFFLQTQREEKLLNSCHV